MIGQALSSSDQVFVGPDSIRVQAAQPAVTFNTHTSYRALLVATERESRNEGWKSGFIAGFCYSAILFAVGFAIWAVVR